MRKIHLGKIFVRQFFQPECVKTSNPAATPNDEQHRTSFLFKLLWNATNHLERYSTCVPVLVLFTWFNQGKISGSDGCFVPIFVNQGAFTFNHIIHVFIRVLMKRRVPSRLYRKNPERINRYSVVTSQR